LIAVAILLGLTIAMFGDVLFASKSIVLSEGSDLSILFIPLRHFGFSELRQRNLALWNPHIYSGTPFLGTFQSALLYPLNFPYLVLSLPKAINLDIALHIFLLGMFMYLWAWHRKLHPLACLLSSILLMFCGAHFMHISAGHLTILSSAVWAPLIFLSIDGLFEKRSLGWVFLGMFAVSMQIFAGYPQYVFCTAVAAAIYSAFCIVRAKQRGIIALGLIGIFAGGIALGAVQLFTGIHAAGESVRSTGLPSYGFSALFSFPPENLITLLAPGFLGNIRSIPYWGRWYLWEMSLFVGVTGFVLAIYGAIYGDRNIRRFSVPMVIILTLLAFGAYTPLFKILYKWVPGFNKFRGSSRFLFQVSLFLIMLAGIGIDHIIRRGNVNRRTPFVVLIAGVLVGIAAVSIHHSAAAVNPAGLWQQIMRAVYEPFAVSVPEKIYISADFIKKTGLFASKSLMISAGTLLLLSALFFLTRVSNKAACAIALLAVVEIFVFARTSRPTFDFTTTQLPGLKSFLAEHPGDYRILQFQNPNSAMSLGTYDIWGYDPCRLGRYAQFIAFTQRREFELSRYHRLYRMLRCRYAFATAGDKIRVTEFNDIMPRLQLIQDYVVIPDRNQIFRAMEDTAFDPRRKVILETLPDPEPVKSEEKGTAKILNSSTDHLTIEANLPNPAILLITDAYSKGWRARALPGSIQKQYDVMPANYVLRAIPLSAGHHRIRVEYLPMAFRVGKWISIVSVIIYVGLLGWYWKRTKGAAPMVRRNNNGVYTK
jgi:hypothetical protein